MKPVAPIHFAIFVTVFFSFSGAQLPCGDKLASLPSAGSQDPVPFLAAASCLRASDSVAAKRGDAGARCRLERNPRKPGYAPRPADSLLKARLPDQKNWYLAHCERLMARRETEGSLDMAYLAEAKGLFDADVFRELSVVYLQAGDAYRADLALLREAEADSTQAGYAQYQIETALRSNAGEEPPAAMLDSLESQYAAGTARSAELLEQLCWNSRAYRSAYNALLKQMAFAGRTPASILERVARFQSLGYFDFAAAVLDKLDWRKLPQPALAAARAQYLQVHMRLEDWPAVAAEDPGVTGGLRPSAYSQEEILAFARAQLELGRPQAALDRIKIIEDKPEAPWGYRARLLKAQAQMAMAKPREAAQTLDALKKDPRRSEGTGPILFWQGCLAIEQGRYASAESLLVLASAYTGADESQRALEYRFYLLLDTSAARAPFFRGLPESPHGEEERLQALKQVPESSYLWVFAQLEKAQIHLQRSEPDSAETVLDRAAKRSPDRLAGFAAEAKAAFVREKLPGGREAALARYEDLLVKYQQGVIPEFSRGRIRALR